MHSPPSCLCSSTLLPLQFICLAFYQKEMALYVRKNLDRHVHSFCVDADMHPEFKVGWGGCFALRQPLLCRWG